MRSYNSVSPILGCLKIVLSNVFLILTSVTLIKTGAVYAQTDSIDSVLKEYGQAIIRVPIPDADKTLGVGQGLEPMQAQYDKGYFVFHVDKAAFEKIKTNFLSKQSQITLDIELTDKYIIHSPRQAQATESLFKVPAPNGLAVNSDLDASNYPTIPGSDFSCYRTVEGTYATAQDIVSNFPNLASWTDVGDSWQKVNNLGGYDLNVLKLTNNSVSGPKPKVFFTSSIHAREYAPAELMTRFAVHLVENYSIDADTTWVLDHHEIHFMLHANPDGRKMAETGLLWRKNTNQNYCGPTDDLRGADLNRNFEFQWNCCNGSDDDDCGILYHGISANSEPETQAIQNYLRSQFADTRGPGLTAPAAFDTMGVYADVHSAGRMVLWPWPFNNTLPPNGAQMRTLARKLAFYNNYRPMQWFNGLGEADGTVASFAYGELGLPAFTIETATQWFETCDYFNNTLLPANLPALSYFVKTARAAYLLPSGPNVINQMSSAGTNSVPMGSIITLSATATDAQFSTRVGTEPTQAIVSAEYFVDVPPWSVNPAPVSTPMSPVDGNFNTSVESIQATLDTSALSLGRHLIYIQATDASGATGVVSGLFVDIEAPVNLPPQVVNPGTQSNEQNSTVSLQIVASDPESQTITYNASGLPGDLSINASTGLISGTVSDTPQNYNVQVDVDDGALVTTVNFSWNVTEANQPPVLANPGGQVNVETDSVNLAISASDPDMDTLSFNATGMPADLSINSVTGIISGTLGFDSQGAYNIGVTVSDGSATDSVNFSWEITNTNRLPQLDTPLVDLSNQTGETVSISVDASDPDGDVLNYSATGLPVGLSIDAMSGIISGTISAIPGQNFITISISDNQATTDATFNWEIVPNTGNCSIDVNFESGNSGWVNDSASTCSTGAFVTAVPTQIINGGVTTQVEGDHTSGNGQALFTAVNTSAGVNDVDQGECSAQSPDYPVSSDSELSIWYFHGQRDSGDDGNGDYFRLEYSLDAGVNWLVLASNTDNQQNASWTQATTNLNAGSSVRVRVLASDGPAAGDLIEAGVDDFKICSVATQNSPPVIQSPGDQQNQQAQSVSLQINASDADNDTLVFSATGLPDGLIIDDSSGEISGVLTALAGDYTVGLSVSDGTVVSEVMFVWTIDAVPATSWLEALTLISVADNWVSADFNQSYADPVAACSVVYENNTQPVVVRMRNLSIDGFEIKLQNPAGNSIVNDTVHCIIMEAGSWLLPDGRLIEAQHYLSTTTNHKQNWQATPNSFLNSYITPVVLGQVMTHNDSDWSVFWDQGVSRTSAPTNNAISTGKHVGEDSDTTRVDEEVGFIVVEQGSGIANGIAYEARLGTDTVRDLGKNPVSYSFAQAFSSQPDVAVISMAAMDGGNGGWAVLRGATALNESSITTAIDEDTIQDSERAHTTEQVAYFVFQFVGSVQLAPAP